MSLSCVSFAQILLLISFQSVFGTKGQALVALSLKGLGLFIGQSHELSERPVDDSHTLLELLLGNAQRGSETDDVAVGRLGEDPVLLEQQAELPSGATIGRILVNDNGVQKTTSTNQSQSRPLFLDLVELAAEIFAHGSRMFNQFLLLDDLESSHSDSTSKRVTAIGGAVLARLDAKHHIIVSKDSTDRVDTSRQSLSEQNDIRLDIVVINTEHLSGTGKASLDLIGNHKDIVLGAQLPDLGEVAIIRHDNTSLTLDGFDKEGSDILAVVLENVFQVLNVVVADEAASLGAGRANVGEIWAEFMASFGIGRHGDDTNSASVEVLSARKDDGFALWNLLLLVTPLARKLDGGLNSLGTSVHGEDLVIAKVLGDVFGILAKYIIVKRTRAQAEALGLRAERLDDLWVRMTCCGGGGTRDKKNG